MRRALPVTAVLFAFLSAVPGLLQAQPRFASYAELHAAALAALGSSTLQALEFHGSGWEGCLGQPWRIDAGWARWELLDYRRVMAFDRGQSIQTAQRRAGMDPERLGGCGAQPGAAPVAQQSAITPATAWPNQLPLWLTPQGLFALAAQHAPDITRNDSGWQLSFSVAKGGVDYPFSAQLDERLFPLRIETRIDNTVYGDMLVEAEFSDYRDFAGVLFPARMIHKQGGYAVLDLTIDRVIPNSSGSTEAPAPPVTGGGGGTQQLPVAVSLVEVGPGIHVSLGTYQGVIVDMESGLVVIDGLQSDARAAELIAQAKALFPGKPLRYVISTHNHFDHAAGLRAFVAEGATVITHKMNEDFFRTALAAPRTLDNPDPREVPVAVLGVGDFFVLSDRRNRIELYRLQGSLHADDMLVVYLPAINAVVEADLLQPWINPVFGGNSAEPHPFLVHLADELQRLGLPYTQFIPIHSPPQAPFMSKDDLLSAIGRGE
jgi:glyoxylase-like metal-dependent hydrolase (beta-lactamase superfamily II)